MIVIGFGSNLPSRFGDSVQTCYAALAELESRGITIVQKSGLYKTAPVPVSNQEWFVNGVVEVQTKLEPEALLDVCHEIEQKFDRTRQERNAARTLDLDLIIYHDRVIDAPIHVPHKRMHLRAFVLLPLKDIAPGWTHPRNGRTIDDLLENMPTAQEIEVLDTAPTV